MIQSVPGLASILTPRHLCGNPNRLAARDAPKVTQPQAPRPLPLNFASLMMGKSSLKLKRLHTDASRPYIIQQVLRQSVVHVEKRGVTHPG